MNKFANNFLIVGEQLVEKFERGSFKVVRNVINHAPTVGVRGGGRDESAPTLRNVRWVYVVGHELGKLC